MATVAFSKLAGILSAALSQHHVLEFEIRIGKKKTVVEMLIVFIMVPNALWSP